MKVEHEVYINEMLCTRACDLLDMMSDYENASDLGADEQEMLIGWQNEYKMLQEILKER